MKNAPFNIPRYYIGCNCEDGHTSDEGVFLDGIFFDANDWWVADQCPKCNVVTVVGSPNLYLNGRTVNVSGKTYCVVEPRYI